jgi:hypothetical protein
MKLETIALGQEGAVPFARTWRRPRNRGGWTD